MTTSASPFHAATAENATEDDPATASDAFFYTQDDSDPSANVPEISGDPDADDIDPKQAKEPLPMQKRRRVTRACDECRRKKIKCDGKQPCTHCTVYSYECTYDQPSNRRRNPAPQYVEALENRLHKAEALLRVVLPDINLDDPRFDVHATQQMLATVKREKLPQQPQQPQEPAPQFPPSQPQTLPPAHVNSRPTVAAAGPADAAPEHGGCEESLLESMVDNSGFLDLDDQGHWDYHGHTSGVIFIRRLRKQLGAADISAPTLRSRSITQQMLDSPKSASESPQDATLPPTHDLPPRDVARRLCYNALEDGCSLMRFVHEPSFFATFERVYDTPPEQYSNEENSFLPLLYIVMSVGCLFSDDRTGPLDLSGYESAIGQGFQFFKAGRQLLEITDCRDLTSLQAICFMVLFLQSSAKLSTCYSYVGIALRSALRLGLHRSAVTAHFNPLERELRKRIFWVVRKMDVYVSTMLGLPQMLSDDDIDQEYPASIDGDFITQDGVLPAPKDYTPLMAGANAHTRLSNIILKVVKYIYPVKNAQHRSESDQRYVVSHSKIREIERDLQAWMEELPAALRPGTEVSPQLERVRQLLRISYAHVQVVMYRPFLHYVSSGSQARGVDRRSYACAAACVSVSRNIVHITTGMHKRGLLNGSFWFTMYTTYFAILSLLFFVLENPDSPTAKDGVLKDAMEGKNTLAGLAKKSMAADRCSQSLNSLFKNLPELLKNRQTTANPVNLKRPAPASNNEVNSNTNSTSPLFEKQPPQRSSTFPIQLLNRGSKEASNTPKSLDDSSSGHRRSPSNARLNHASTWFASTPEGASEPVSTPSDTYPVSEPVGASSNTASPMPMSLPMRDASATQYASHPFNTNAANLPDLMGIMFPSDDPFAYPTQPMSTLEDGHFRQDGGAPFGVNPASQQSAISSGPETMGVSTPNLDNFANFPLFPNGTPTPMHATLPTRLANPSHISQSRLQSPVSHGSTPGATGEAVNSPDLVSLPNNNYMWQGYNFQPQDFQQGVSAQPAMPSGQAPDLGMGLDDPNSLGMGIDLGISLDDIFGNGDATRGGLPIDDWTQWNPSG
ncbi:putative C6 transcription factor (Mut3) [Aspergillus melleus]|uniref:putative C6 transcription factor (Mut3) n=1 Tax=Aspergillus melleus TaxID=138277 RepID=UPI001E8CB829|nr:Gypsy retrotransposon integrase-like protein 1 [Aspergillus melleus]KAH8426887.1 Gypsy retrotransposon integrase-like protein 1 [Aspergillus melleus]